MPRVENYFDISNNRSQKEMVNPLGLQEFIDSGHSVGGFCLYLPSIDRYLTSGGIHNEEELNQFMVMEKKWKDSLPRVSFSDAIAMFPEALQTVRKILKQKEKKALDEIRALHEDSKTYYNEVINKADFRDQFNLIQQLNHRTEYSHQILDARLKKIRKCLFSLEVRENPSILTQTQLTDDMIAKAKEVPIESFMEMNRASFILCPYHGDRHPSMHVYKDNRAYCFTCQKRADSIDLAMAVNRLEFKEAVKWLLRQ